MGSLKVPALVASVTDNPATALRPSGRLTHDPISGALAIHDGVTPGGDRLNRFRRTGTGATDQKLKDTIASYEVTPEQFGAVGDGVTNDAPAIQRALDHIATLATAVAGQVRPGALLFTAGKRYKCDAGLVADRAYHNLFGYAVLDFSSWTGVYLLWTGAYSDAIFGDGNGYGQNGCMDGQIVIYGSGANKASVGIKYDSPNVSSCTHIRTIGVTVANVGVAFQIGDRGYNQEFINCKAFGCGIIFDWPGTGADNDERTTVFGGTFYNSGTFIRHTRPAGGFYVYSASCDYCAKLVEIGSGKVQWFGVHTESSNWVEGCIDVSGNGGLFAMFGGWLLMQTNLGGLTHYVKVGAGSAVKFENVLTNNTNSILTPDASTPTTWATGAGRFEMHHCEPAFEFGGFPARQHTDYSLLSDGGFERPLGEDVLWINKDTTLGSDRYTAQNLQLTRATTNQMQGSGCLRLDKQFGSTSDGSIILMAIPVQYGDKVSAGFRVRTAPDRTGSNQTLIVSGGFARLDGFGAGNRPNITRFSPPGDMNITPASTSYQLVVVPNGLSQVTAPSWATHYIVQVDAVAAHQASWCFDGLWADRW